MSEPWLVIIDPQHCFARPPSPWASPMFPAAAENMLRLAASFPGRTIVTRFLAPANPQGSWVDYYGQWPEALLSPGDPFYAELPEFAALEAHRIAEPTFGKWGSALQSITGANPHLVLSGVSTDCCVISTALPALDAGAHVTVAADACAGSSEQAHLAALDVMGGYPPQLRIATVDQIMRP